jgi:putative N6-adenine-specific DNA methylase
VTTKRSARPARAGTGRILAAGDASSARRDAIRHAAFAISAPGLSPLTAEELRSLGLSVSAVDAAGVAFECDLRDLARANVHLRTASRVLVRVDEFRAATFHELEKRVARVEWGRWIAPGRDVTIRVTCRKSRLYHSGAVAERIAAVLAPFAGRVGGVKRVAETDDAEPAPPDAASEPNDGDTAQLLVVRLLDDRCTLSIDSSGALLHQRGYRLVSGKAPLRETLGAALLLASGWVPGTPLLDPFCGSGTLAIEAAMLARRIAPGRTRAFAFEQWPGVDPTVLDGVRAQARAAERESAGAPILASDRDAGVIEGAVANAERAGVAGDIRFSVGAVSSLALPEEIAGPGCVVTNPPYGVRVGDSAELRNLYARTGSVLRRQCAGWRIAIVSADRRLVGQLGIPLVDALRTSNGGLPITFAVGEIPPAG